MNNLPIIFVIPWYGYFAGGAEVAARLLAEQLVDRGFSVQVLTTCCRSPFDSWWQDTIPAGVENINGVIVRRFPVNPNGEKLYHEVNHRIIHGMEVNEIQQQQFVQNSINSDALVNYADANTEGHLVIGLPYTQGLIYSLVKALKHRASIMPCFHNEPQIKWTTTAELLVQSRYIFFLSEEEKALAIQHFGHLIGKRLVESSVVGVGMELPLNIEKLFKSNSSTQKDIQVRYQLPDVFFVYVGRKDAGKNIFTLINYFKDYQANGGEATLVFLGGGDVTLVPVEKGFLDLGFIPEEDKYLVVSQAVSLINLSKNESFSIVLMEAWLCDIPVVVHQECEVAMGHCRKSQGGIPISSSEEFQAALMLLSDQHVSKVLARSGKYYVKSNYSWDSVLDRFLRGACWG